MHANCTGIDSELNRSGHDGLGAGRPLELAFADAVEQVGQVRTRPGHARFDARRAGSVVEILLGMIVLGLLWYAVDSWILVPIERRTVQRWGFVAR